MRKKPRPRPKPMPKSELSKRISQNLPQFQVYLSNKSPDSSSISSDQDDFNFNEYDKIDKYPRLQGLNKNRSQKNKVPCDGINQSENVDSVGEIQVNFENGSDKIENLPEIKLEVLGDNDIGINIKSVTDEVKTEISGKK